MDETPRRFPTGDECLALRNWHPGPPCIPPALAGHASISPTGRFEAGSYQTFKLTYTAGRFGIDESGSIKVLFRFATDHSRPQLTDPTAPNYVTVAASNGAVLECRHDAKQNVRPWDRTLHITLVRGSLAHGDTITVIFGERSGGSPGMRIQTFVEPLFEFHVLVDPIATYHYVPLPHQPTIEIVAGPPARWVAVLPTLRQCGQSFALKLRAEDRWGNPTDRADAVLRLQPSRPVLNLPERVCFSPGCRAMVLDELAVRECGDLTITVLAEAERRGEAATVVATSNVLRIASVDAAADVHFWSDLHAQSAETIGTNSARSFFAFGRDAAFVDAIAHQGNDFQITQRFWRDLSYLSAEFNKDGRYVTLPGYEWSGNTALGGDRNVYFSEEGPPIRRSSHALVPDRSDEETDCHSARALFEALRRERKDVVCCANVGGRYADIKLAHDGAIERSVEVHSSWGTFEWLVRDAFESGYRVGIVANSDDHKGRPGASAPGASLFGAYGGLTCLIMPELSRAAVFACLRKRRHYATTGSRLFLDVRAVAERGGSRFAEDPALGRTMGEQAKVFRIGDIASVADAAVTLRIEVASTSPIERVEIRNGVRRIETFRPYGRDELGSRIRVIWSGAEYRGRMRQTIWDGTATIAENSFSGAAPINFFNLEKTLDRDGERQLSWRALTTGNFGGFEARLAHREDGVLSLRTRLVEQDLAIRSIGYEDTVFEAGGLERMVRVFRLPDSNPHRSVMLERRVALRRGEDNPIYVCVTTEDGHQAWSSPIYFIEWP